MKAHRDACRQEGSASIGSPQLSAVSQDQERFCSQAAELEIFFFDEGDVN
jgi:hypothetical protein